MFALLGVLVLVAAAIPAAAEEHTPPHAHMLVQRVELGEVDGTMSLVGFRKCVDLAANQPIPLNAHHEHIHTGGTAISFGNQLSGHWVVPTAPFFFPWENCEQFAASLPLPLD
jgi:hypothetical protein